MTTDGIFHTFCEINTIGCPKWGNLSTHVSNFRRRVFDLASKPFGRFQLTTMSFCGPVVIVLIVVMWDFGLMRGAALVIHPALGSSVTNSNGATPTDFVTAWQAADNSTSIVGSGDFSPQNRFRLYSATEKTYFSQTESNASRRPHLRL